MDFIRCPRCNEQMSVEALFCSRCGTALSAQSTPMHFAPAEGQTQGLGASTPAVPQAPIYVTPYAQPNQASPAPYQPTPPVIYPHNPGQPVYQSMPQGGYAPMPPQPFYAAPVQQVNVVMTQQAMPAPITAVVVMNNKSVALAFLLTLLFGPLGMLYSTVRGGLIMLFVSIFCAAATAGISVPLTWIICMIWGCSAARNPTA